MTHGVIGASDRTGTHEAPSTSTERRERLVGADEVCYRLDWSTRTLARRISNGDFPPGKRDGRARKWLESVVDVEVLRRAAGGDDDAGAT